MARRTKIIKPKLETGTILGFSGSWGSGIGHLKIKKKGKIINVPAENPTTVRALESAFGNTIGEGHTVKPKGGFVGKKIKFMRDDIGLLQGFSPI